MLADDDSGLSERECFFARAPEPEPPPPEPPLDVDDGPPLVSEEGACSASSAGGEMPVSAPLDSR